MIYDDDVEDPYEQSQDVPSTYTLEETIVIGEEYLNAYNLGVDFTMEKPIIEVNTEDQIETGGFKGLSLGAKFGIFGGGAVLIAGVVAAIILLRRGK